MIFLLNRERVLSEILELTKLQISKQLGVSESKVHIKVDLENGSIKPSFGIDEDVDPIRVKSVIGDVWGVLREELANRLQDLNTRRYGYR